MKGGRLKILDCENLDRAVVTLSDLFGCKPEAFRIAIESVPYDEWLSNSEQRDYYVQLHEFIRGHLDRCLGSCDLPEEVCWFHLTRVFSGCDFFSSGIVPLGAAIDSIWDGLESIFSESDVGDNLKLMRGDNIGDYLYDMKVNEDFHWGPYAMLVKDVAFIPDSLGSHDYLNIPEIVEDICNRYLDVYGVALYDLVCSSTRPCVVKFMNSRDVNEGQINAALIYTHNKIKNIKLNFDANTCFDSLGEVINPEDIIYVHYV